MIQYGIPRGDYVTTSFNALYKVLKNKLYCASVHSNQILEFEIYNEYDHTYMYSIYICIDKSGYNILTTDIPRSNVFGSYTWPAYKNLLNN